MWHSASTSVKAGPAHPTCHQPARSARVPGPAGCARAPSRATDELAARPHMGEVLCRAAPLASAGRARTTDEAFRTYTQHAERRQFRQPRNVGCDTLAFMAVYL